MAGGASTISLDVERTHACDVQAKGQIRLRNIQHGSITIGLVLDNGTRATDFYAKTCGPTSHHSTLNQSYQFTEHVNLRRERLGYRFGAYKAWIIVCCSVHGQCQILKREAVWLRGSELARLGRSYLVRLMSVSGKETSRSKGLSLKVWVIVLAFFPQIMSTIACMEIEARGPKHFRLGWSLSVRFHKRCQSQGGKGVS